MIWPFVKFRVTAELTAHSTKICTERGKKYDK